MLLIEMIQTISDKFSKIEFRFPEEAKAIGPFAAGPLACDPLPVLRSRPARINGLRRGSGSIDILTSRYTRLRVVDFNQ
jgi:hypothetical protein